jgi:hypothetical protein
VLVSAKLESKQKHNNGGANEHKPGKVERLDGGPQDLEGWALGFGFWDCIEQKEPTDYHAEWEVDIETYTSKNSQSAIRDAPRRETYTISTIRLS